MLRDQCKQIPMAPTAIHPCVKDQELMIKSLNQLHNAHLQQRQSTYVGKRCPPTIRPIRDILSTRDQVPAPHEGTINIEVRIVLMFQRDRESGSMSTATQVPPQGHDVPISNLAIHGQIRSLLYLIIHRSSRAQNLRPMRNNYSDFMENGHHLYHEMPTIQCA